MFIILFYILITLKLVGLTDISWFYVWLPFTIHFICMVIVVAGETIKKRGEGQINE